MWPAIVITAVGCYLLKLIGVSMPGRVIEHPLVARVAVLIPVALLGALVAVETLSTGQSLRLDLRLAGLAAAVLALLLRAPFLVVVAVAALTTVLLRLVI